MVFAIVAIVAIKIIMCFFNFLLQFDCFAGDVQQVNALKLGHPLISVMAVRIQSVYSNGPKECNKVCNI